MEMRTLRILLIVAAGLVLASDEGSASTVNKDCPEKRLKQCMNHLQAINKDHNLAFATTEEELKSMCRKMKTGLDCVYGHVTNCFPKESRMAFYQLLEGTREVIRLLCTKGPFRKRYKIHAPCMKNVSTDQKFCGVQYQDLVKSVSPNASNTPSDTTRKQCCAYHSYLLCVTEATEVKCGNDAALFMKEYSKKTAGPLVQNQCKNYLAGSMMCSIGNSAPTPMSSLVWLFMASSSIAVQYL